MPEHQKIVIEAKQDREAVILVLARNGYTVRQGRTKTGKSNNYTYYVEYWKEGATA